jgi:hypothetical protein
VRRSSRAATQENIEGADYRLPVSEAPPAILSPLLSARQLCAGTPASAKGLDSDHPTGLTKVTLAQ